MKMVQIGHAIHRDWRRLECLKLFIGATYGDFFICLFIVTIYAQFVSQKDTNLPPGIVNVIFVVQYVSFRGAN